MTTIDVTQQVMQSVGRFEKKRSRLWFFKFFLTIIVLLGIIGWGIWQVVGVVADPEFLAVFSLYTHDSESFSEYWKEAIAFVWQNLPQLSVGVALLSFLIFAMVIIATRRRRRVTARRLREVNKYHL